MPLTRQRKEELLAEISDLQSRATAGLVADYAGLTVAQVTEVRRAFRAIGAEYKVVKNTLFKRAVKGSPREAISKIFNHTTAVAFKFDDEFGKLGKVAQELAKKFDKLKFKAGFVENDVMPTARALETIAALPTKDEARAQLLGVINAPAAKLLATINAPASHVVGVIQAKVDKDKGA